jgi:uncharacterized protein (TIGR02996 family)
VTAVEDPVELERRRRIVAEPNSDELRQVYADYWEEVGDHDRAELIRVDLELALAGDEPRSQRLHAHRSALLEPNRARWTAPLRSFARVKLRRGLVADLGGPVEDLLGGWPAPVCDHPIERLSLWSRRVPGMMLGPALARYPAPASIRELELARLPAIEVSELARFTSLCELVLDAATISVVAALAQAAPGLDTLCRPRRR